MTGSKRWRTATRGRGNLDIKEIGAAIADRAQDSLLKTTRPGRIEMMTDDNPANGGSTPSNDELLSNAEAAKLLGLTPDTLRSYRSKARKRGPTYSKVGHSVFYRRSVIEAYLENGEG